jgi:hypothetical protein
LTVSEIGPVILSSLLIFSRLRILLCAFDPTQAVGPHGLGFCAGLGFFSYGFLRLRKTRLASNPASSEARSATDQLTEISGLATGPYTMSSAITARPCYYYQTRVYEWQQRSHTEEWVKIAAECVYIPFFIAGDSGGPTLVDPRGAALDLHCDFQEEFSDSLAASKDPAARNVRNFLVRHGIDTSNKIKVEEFCIKPRTALFILGVLKKNPGIEIGPTPIPDIDALDPSSMNSFSVSFALPSPFAAADASEVDGRTVARPVSQPQAASHSAAQSCEVIRLTPEDSAAADETTQQQKIAAALAKAGISNPAAWTPPDTANSPEHVNLDSPQSHSRHNGDDSSGFDPHPAVVLAKGSYDQTFLISWRTQQRTPHRMKWKYRLMMWGGGALALLCLLLILHVV